MLEHDPRRAARTAPSFLAVRAINQTGCDNSWNNGPRDNDTPQSESSPSSGIGSDTFAPRSHVAPFAVPTPFKRASDLRDNNNHAYSAITIKIAARRLIFLSFPSHFFHVTVIDSTYLFSKFDLLHFNVNLSSFCVPVCCDIYERNVCNKVASVLECTR